MSVLVTAPVQSGRRRNARQGRRALLHNLGVAAAGAAPPERVLYRYREGCASDAATLLGLIEANRESGHLLARSLDDLAAHATRFVVATCNGAIAGCAELAPLGARVAEVRSLVVQNAHRGCGIASHLIDRLIERAARQKFDTICAFTHDAGCFLRWGFTVVTHADVPEKIAADCRGCHLAGRCGQHALVLPVRAAAARHSSTTPPEADRGLHGQKQEAVPA